MEELIRKKSRQKKQEKRRFSKGSSTLAGQVLRMKTVKGYQNKSKPVVKIKSR